MDVKPIALLGDGGWGTALACVLAGKGHTVKLWGAFPEVTAEIADARENKRFLPGVTIPDEVTPVCEMETALVDCGLVVFSTPVVYLRSVAEKAAKLMAGQKRLRAVCVAKGIERETLLRASEVLADALGGDEIGMLFGPSHAEEVARGMPTTVVAAARDDDFARMIQTTFMTGSFRVYTSNDPVGVEIGAAVKNVIAVAAGICDGLNLGDNAKAALLTRGLAEIARLGMSLGAKRETFAGLSGLGDLITTCVSPHGRNRRIGLEIGQGKSLDEALEALHPMVPEGVFTTQSVYALAKREGVEMPISQAVYEVLINGKPPIQAVGELMTREAKPE